jgi:hypothetical protein
LAPTPDVHVAHPARRGVVSTRLAPRASLLQGGARALDATQALLRTQAALVRRDAERRIEALGLGLALAAAAGTMLVAAWALGLIAAVMAADALSVPVRLAAVAALHAALGVALLVWRARVARGGHG